MLANKNCFILLFPILPLEKSSEENVGVCIIPLGDKLKILCLEVTFVPSSIKDLSP